MTAIAADAIDPLDAPADEIAAEPVRMAEESPDGLAFLDRIMERIAQTRCIVVTPAVNGRLSAHRT